MAIVKLKAEEAKAAGLGEKAVEIKVDMAPLKSGDRGIVQIGFMAQLSETNTGTPVNVACRVKPAGAAAVRPNAL